MLFSATAARAFILLWQFHSHPLDIFSLKCAAYLQHKSRRFAHRDQMLGAAKELRASEDEGPKTFTGERPVDRTLFILLSLVVVTVSSLLFGWYQDSSSQLPY
jgi:hypothetical protein